MTSAPAVVYCVPYVFNLSQLAKGSGKSENRQQPGGVDLTILRVYFTVRLVARIDTPGWSDSEAPIRRSAAYVDTMDGTST